MNLLLDNPKSLFIKYLVPSVGSALVVTIYSFVDTIAIGPVSYTHLDVYKRQTLLIS